MAIADTARLIASLELQDKFSPSLKKAEGSLGNFQRNVGSIGKGVGQVGAGIGRIATNLAKLGVAGGVALGAFIGANLKAGIEQIKLLELATAQTNAVLASTGGIAGQTGESIRALAEKYENLNATVDDKVIQSAENLLLTFTNIRTKAFEPALQAALDMNQAMGGGEEGLQKTIILVGKALQDPIRGATALRRVGVNLSAQQQAQIKVLIKQNDLYGAQQLILAELATEFGGSFAAAGDTAAGRMANLGDKVEDLQRTFAGPFALVLDRTVGKLGDFLGEANTVRAVERLGAAIARMFTDEAIDRGIGVLRGGLDLLSPGNLSRIGAGVGKAFDFVKSLDFTTIGKGLELTARIAKTAIDAFLALPKELQGVAIAALAANKLSGGLITSGIGNIAKGLGGLLTGGGLLGRGSSRFNPLWVQSATIGGVGGPPGTAGGGFGLAGAIGTAGIVAAITGGIQNLQDSQNAQTNQDAIDVLGSASIGGLIAKSIGEPIQDLIDELTGNKPGGKVLGVVDKLPRGRANLSDPMIDRLIRDGMLPDTAMLATGTDMGGTMSDTAMAPLRNTSTSTRLTADRVSTVNSLLRQQGDTLRQIRDKPATFNFTIPVSINASLIQSKILQIRKSAGGGGTGGSL